MNVMASRKSIEVSAEVVQKVLELMALDGVELTDDLNQCESAILEWIHRVGAGALENHLSQKNSVTRDRAGRAHAGRISGSSATGVVAF